MNNLKSWTKYVGKKHFEELRNLGIKIRDVYVDFNRLYIICGVHTNNEVGWGIAICSTIDEFRFDKGVPKALGRAIKALKTKKSDLPVRKNFREFSDDWTMRQIRRVLDSPFLYKSIYEVV
jgi:hypothetical protein